MRQQLAPRNPRATEGRAVLECTAESRLETHRLSAPRRKAAEEDSRKCAASVVVARARRAGGRFHAGRDGAGEIGGLFAALAWPAGVARRDRRAVRAQHPASRIAAPLA